MSNDKLAMDCVRRLYEEGERVEHLRSLLSTWYENWNDGSQPDGDLLADTLAALEDAEQ